MGTQKIRNLPTVHETGVWSLGQKYPRRTEWQPTPVFLPAEFRGQRSLVGYNPRSHIELDPAEWLTFSLCMWRKDSLHVTRSRKCIDLTKLSMLCFYRWKTPESVVKNHELCSIFPNLSSCYYIHRCSITSVSPLSPIRTRKWLIYLLPWHD